MYKLWVIRFYFQLISFMKHDKNKRKKTSMNFNYQTFSHSHIFWKCDVRRRSNTIAPFCVIFAMLYLFFFLEVARNIRKVAYQVRGKTNKKVGFESECQKKEKKWKNASLLITVFRKKKNRKNGRRNTREVRCAR